MGLFRKSNHGYDIKIYYGVRFLPLCIKNARKKGMKYFLVVDGVLTKQSSKFHIIEKAYLKTCKLCYKPHEKSLGRFDILKHKLVKNKVVLK